jgi:predicted DNA-binding transcriptional regulator AlpA
MITDFMTEQEVSTLIGKKRTAPYRLRKQHGFPEPVLTHPAKYSRQAVNKMARGWRR